MVLTPSPSPFHSLQTKYRVLSYRVWPWRASETSPISIGFMIYQMIPQHRVLVMSVGGTYNVRSDLTAENCVLSDHLGNQLAEVVVLVNDEAMLQC